MRFLALAAGVSYGAMTALTSRSGIRIGFGRLRNWEDAKKRIGRKLLTGEALQLLVKYAPPHTIGTEPVDVPGDVYGKITKAWKEFSAPGCSMLRTKEEIDWSIVGERSNMSLEEVRIASQIEQLRFKKMQSKRLNAMMCDKKSVEADALQLSMKLQRWIRTLPAQVTGILVKITAMGDAELREIEKQLENELPTMLREFRADLGAIPEDTAAIAAARRYANRGVASIPGKP